MDQTTEKAVKFLKQEILSLVGDNERITELSIELSYDDLEDCVRPHIKISLKKESCV